MSHKYEGTERRKEEHGDDVLDLLRFEARETHDTRALLERIYIEVQDMKQTQEGNAAKIEKMAEIIDAWDSAKGFVKTVSAISRIVKWTLVSAGTISALAYAIDSWLRGRGH